MTVSRLEPMLSVTIETAAVTPDELLTRVRVYA